MLQFENKHLYRKYTIHLFIAYVNIYIFYVYKTEIKRKGKSLLRVGFETPNPIVMQIFLN